MIEIWYRLNTIAEKELFSYNNLVDGIIIPANFIAFYDPSLINFISDIKLPFIIDPMTYVCQNSNNVTKNKMGNLKKSYQKYYEKMNIDKKFFDINYITKINDTDLNNFINKILNFQYKLVSKEDPRKKSIDRIRALQQKLVVENKIPSSLIPPYYYFTQINDEYYNLNKKIIDMAQKLKIFESIEISPCICFSKNVLLDKSARDQIVNDFSTFKKILLWVDDFDDRNIDLSGLACLKSIIQKFHENKVNVLNMYGSYFSILLRYNGLDAFSSGICISHKKSVDSAPTGGGQPLRYYDPILKLEIVNNEAFKLYTQYPELFICNCPICQSYTSQINDITSLREREKFLNPLFLDQKYSNNKALMNWKNARIHFMHIRRKEIEEQNHKIKNELLDKLKKDYDYVMKNVDFSIFKNINSVEHIKRWFQSL